LSVLRNLTRLALAEMHLDLLYHRDGAGLLLRSRDPDVATPFFHLIRTTEGNRWLLSSALSEEQRRELGEVLASEPVIGDLSQMESRPPVLHGVPALLAAERPTAVDECGPAFLFPDRLVAETTIATIVREPGDIRPVPELAWIRDVGSSAQPLAVARNSAGEVVAVCHSARATRDAAEAGVETARNYRGRGLAGAVVLAWAAAVQAEGRLPVYSTQWTNQASRAVARKLRLVMFGEDYHLG
jgi:hypothetical protein